MNNIFTDMRELYEDMLNNCKGFILGHGTMHTGVSGETAFSEYEFQDFNFSTGSNELDFWQSKSKDGANLYLKNVVKGERIGDLSKNEILEYRFWMKDITEPFIMLAVRWNCGVTV